MMAKRRKRAFLGAAEKWWLTGTPRCTCGHYLAEHWLKDETGAGGICKFCGDRKCMEFKEFKEAVK
jgi:hypothetical protein